jgi:hypothetical protein
VYRSGRHVFGMSWSDHASLGVTFSVGAGRVW